MFTVSLRHPMAFYGYIFTICVFMWSGAVALWCFLCLCKRLLWCSSFAEVVALSIRWKLVAALARWDTRFEVIF